MGQMFEGGDQFCLGLLGRARDPGEAGDSKGIAFSLVMSSPEVFCLFVCLFWWEGRWFVFSSWKILIRVPSKTDSNVKTFFPQMTVLHRLILIL